MKNYLYIQFRPILIIALLLWGGIANAQLGGDNYPVQSHVYVAGGGTLKLADYFTSSTKLNVDLILKDLTKSQLDVYLEWQIEGLGLGIQAGSLPGYVPPTYITLTKGSIKKLKGIDLRAYFQPGVVEAVGVSEATLFNGSLPEGFYIIRVKAYEAGTGRQVSNLAETYFTVAYALPPVINLPLIGSEQTVTRPQSVLLQWMPRHTQTPSSNVVYEATVCEVADDEEPNVTMTGSQTCYTIPQQATTTYLLRASDLPLRMGKRYVFQVRAIDLNEAVEFQNEGRSEVSWFRFGKECTAPENLTINEIGPGRVMLSWKANEQAIGYTVEYKQQTQDDWTSLTTLGITQAISDLKANETYQFRVSSQCDVGYSSSPSEEVEWEMESPDKEDEEWEEWVYKLLHPLDKKIKLPNEGPQFGGPIPAEVPVTNPYGRPITSLDDLLTDVTKIPCNAQLAIFEGCNVATATAAPVASLPLGGLSAGDLVTIADYVVVVTEATGGGSVFSGKGLAKLPYLSDVYIGVEFSNVTIMKDEAGRVGGCITDVPSSGYFRARYNLSPTDIQQEEIGILNALNPDEEIGTLKDLVEDVATTCEDLKAKLQANQPITTSEKDAFLEKNQALIDQLTEWKTNIETLVDELGDGEDLVTQVSSEITKLEAIKTAVTNGTNFTCSATEDVVTDVTTQLEQLIADAKTKDETNDPTITNVVAKNITDNSATLTWKGDKRFTRYVVTYQKPGEGEVTKIVTGTEIELQGLGIESKYDIKIRGYVDGDLVDYKTTTLTTLSNQFPKPQNIVATKIDATTIKLDWDKNTKHVKYKLKYTDKYGNEKFIYPTTNTVTLTGLDPDMSYPFELFAIGEANETASETGSMATELLCNLKVSTTNSIVSSGESVTITALCNGVVTFDTNEGYVTMPSIGKFVLTINPTVTTTYLAECKTTEGSKYKICTQTQTITVEDPICDNFKIERNPITGHELIVNLNDKFELLATGCNGFVMWEMDGVWIDDDGSGNNSKLNITVTEPVTTYIAYCKTTDEIICKKETEIKVYCNVKITDAYLERVRIWEPQELKVKGVAYFFYPFSGILKVSNKDDVILNHNSQFVEIYKRPVSETKIKAQMGICVSDEIILNTGLFSGCTNFRIIDKIDNLDEIEYVDEINQTLEVEGCSKEETIVWYFEDEEVARGSRFYSIPEIGKKGVFKATCKDKCTTLHSTASIVGEFKIKAIPVKNTIDVKEFSASKCYGKITWSSDSKIETTIKENNCTEANVVAPSDCFTSTLTFADKIKEKTTITAYCKDIFGNIKTDKLVLQPTSETCLDITATPAEISQGQKAKLKVAYCNGTVTWYEFESLFPAKTVEIGTGQEIEVAPCGTTAYQAVCSGTPNCGGEIILKVKECTIKILSSVENQDVTFGTCATLTAEGCEAGNIQWEDGSVAKERNVTLLKETNNYTATCITCDGGGCKATIDIPVKLEPPTKFEECIDFKVVQKNIPVRCIRETVQFQTTGCEGGKVLWDNTTELAANKTYEFNYNGEQSINVKCTKYGVTAILDKTIDVSDIIKIEAPSSTMTYNWVTIVGYGCYNANCIESTYNWEINDGNKITNYTGKSINIQLINTIDVTLTCNSNNKKTTKKIVAEIPEKIESCRITTSNNDPESNKVTLNIKNCDIGSPIIWEVFYGYSYFDKDRINKNGELKVYKNMSQIVVDRPPFERDKSNVINTSGDNYYAYCYRNNIYGYCSTQVGRNVENSKSPTTNDENIEVDVDPCIGTPGDEKIKQEHYTYILDLKFYSNTQIERVSKIVWSTDRNLNNIIFSTNNDYGSYLINPEGCFTTNKIYYRTYFFMTDSGEKKCKSSKVTFSPAKCSGGSSLGGQ